MRLAAIIPGLLALVAGGCALQGRAVVGPPPETCDGGFRAVSGVCVGEGTLGFTLTWDQPGDMDLHVVTPAGNEISFHSPMADGGTLDVDDRVGRGPENVYWPEQPVPGNYLVCVVPFSITTPVNFTLTVRRNGATVQEITGMRVMSTGDQTCGASSSLLVATVPVM